MVYLWDASLVGNNKSRSNVKSQYLIPRQCQTLQRTCRELALIHVSNVCSGHRESIISICNINIFFYLKLFFNKKHITSLSNYIYIIFNLFFCVTNSHIYFNSKVWFYFSPDNNFVCVVFLPNIGVYKIKYEPKF